MNTDLNIVWLLDPEGRPEGLYIGENQHNALQYAKGWSKHAPCYIIPRESGPIDDPRPADPSVARRNGFTGP